MHLTDLRDRLKVALSDKPADPEGDEGPSAADLAEQIKALRDTHKVEAAPARIKPRVEKVRRREEPVKVAEQPVIEAPIEEPPPSFRQRVGGKAGQMSLF